MNGKGFSVSTATNRLGVPSGQSGVMGYDVAGNLTNDTYTGGGTRTFDAENRLTSATNIGQAGVSRFSYDGDGRRVRRETQSDDVLDVYDVNGVLLCEYGVNDGERKEYVYRNGEMLATLEVPRAQGLVGEYFVGTNFEQRVTTRTDATVNFDWGVGSPAASVGSDYFSVRWTGTVSVPTTNSYTFYTHSDDGVRLWVDNQLVINNWTWHAPTEDTSSQVTLEAGKRYEVRMEFFEQGGGAMAKLLWSSPSIAKQIIPANYLTPERKRSGWWWIIWERRA